MVIYQNLIKIIAFRLCNFEDIDAKIECHPLESDTRGGPPPVGTPLLAGRHKATRRVTTQHYAIKLALLTRFPPPPPPVNIRFFSNPPFPLIPCPGLSQCPPPLNYVGGEIFRGDVGESMFSNIWGGKIFSHLMGGEIFIFFDNNIHFLPVYH